MAEDDPKRPERVRETWNSFWGWLLLWRFHEDNPERWSARDEKAEWLVTSLALSPGARVIDLACGDGLLDICLAARGLEVIAVDRIASVLDASRREAEARGLRVEFVAADLSGYDFAGPRFDAALFFDTLGLMGRDAERDLLTRLRPALRPRARLVMDWPREASQSQWEHRFSDGILRVTARYDAAERTQTIRPEFHRVDGRVIELHDPYGPPDHAGIRRRIYALEEAQELLAEAGYESEVVPHCRTGGYYMLLASPKAPQTGAAGSVAPI